MIAVVVSSLLELGTAGAVPVRRDRWVVHLDRCGSETPLPERLATLSEQFATTSGPIGTPISADARAVANRLAVAGVLPISEEAQAMVDALVTKSLASTAIGEGRVIRRRSR